MIYAFDGYTPEIGEGTYVSETAIVIGNVRIGDNCYIGPDTIIAKGVKIGAGSIIGANSFVNKSFPENSKIAGSPAKEIRRNDT